MTINDDPYQETQDIFRGLWADTCALMSAEIRRVISPGQFDPYHIVTHQQHQMIYTALSEELKPHGY